MFKIPCEKCKKKIDNNATVCPYCGAQYSPEEIKSRNKSMVIGCLALVLIIGSCSWIFSDGKQAASDHAANNVVESVAESGLSTPEVAEVANAKPSGLTFAQENAVRSATQYLQMSGFSRSGLISQLSSDAGEGYAVADATAAVDSLDVDWNDQAARSAKQYLEMTGFSCKGLIGQLSSSAGDQYTVDQATYGAKQAGAC